MTPTKNQPRVHQCPKCKKSVVVNVKARVTCTLCARTMTEIAEKQPDHPTTRWRMQA